MCCNCDYSYLLYISIYLSLAHREKITQTEELFLFPTGKMHAEHLGCHVVHPSVLGFWSGWLG